MTVVVLQVPASICFAETRFRKVDGNSAGPACKSPLVSSPRTGKADGTSDESGTIGWARFKIFLEGSDGQNSVATESET